METVSKNGEGEETRRYSQGRYWIATIGPLLLLAALLALAVYRLSTGTSTKVDLPIVFVVPVIILLNVFGAQQPKRIIDTPEALIIEGTGQRHVFPWETMTTLKVKEFAFTDRVYLRISPSTFFSGRYWIDMHKYPDFEKLRKKLLAKETELHPEREPYQKTGTAKRKA